MSAHAAIGSKVYIGPVVDTDPADETAYEALTYVEVGETESISDFGDNDEIITVKLLNRGRVVKVKGASDAGDTELIWVKDSTDAGQAAMTNAKKTKHSYAVKITENDASSNPGATPTTHYFVAKVANNVIKIGNAGNLVMASSTFAITSEITSVAAT